VRTAFHDAVARFGGPGSRSNGRCLPVESEMLEPRLTPLSLFGTRALAIKKSRSPSSQDRLTSHRVNDTELPRPRMPSPFASRRAPGWEPREPLGFNPTLARVVPLRTMPIARTSRGRCNTTRDQVALANSRVLATRSWVCRQTSRTTGNRRSDRASRARFRTERDAPVKSVRPIAPSSSPGGASVRDRWPRFGLRAP
jgi:hypothetical protein